MILAILQVEPPVFDELRRNFSGADSDEDGFLYLSEAATVLQRVLKNSGSPSTRARSPDPYAAYLSSAMGEKSVEERTLIFLNKIF